MEVIFDENEDEQKLLHVHENAESNAVDQSRWVSVTEGKAVIQMKPEYNIFYNSAQEVNRDLSVLGIQTFLNVTPPGKKWKGKPENVKVLEAMAASGIRSIRYAKEISGIHKVIANDRSAQAAEVIMQNIKSSNVGSIVECSRADAVSLMYSQPDDPFVVDIDPYGTPVPFLDSAVQCVRDGGILLVTATDLAILAGNAAETCYAKYGSMSLRSEACHEMALRIVIHSVQAAANRYGRYVEPLLSLKLDFYVRLFFRVRRGPQTCKKTVSKTSLVFQCVSCHTFSFQALGTLKPDGKYAFATGPATPEHCEHCGSRKHVGGPIWVAPIHDKSFVRSMMDTLNSTHFYLGTRDRIEGVLSLVYEELETPLFYRTSQFCGFLKTSAIPLLKIRSALLNLGYEVSMSHTGPNSLKTNASTDIIWDVLRAWAYECNSNPETHLRNPSPARTLFLKKSKEELAASINFSVRDDANPASRQSGILRFQQNPHKYFGPGTRSTFNTDMMVGKQKKNQNKRGGNRKRKLPKESGGEGYIENAE